MGKTSGRAGKGKRKRKGKGKGKGNGKEKETRGMEMQMGHTETYTLHNTAHHTSQQSRAEQTSQSQSRPWVNLIGVLEKI